ncbi:MAG: glycosyltransferase family 2 protein [Deltaproteobacteria bacterium]|nr:glycosyltransferase family 2 protein [Deltaproteobacteria bacterium]
MWISTTALYWSSLGVVAYTYAGYPLLINVLSRLRPRPSSEALDAFEPVVTVVLAARNEEARLAGKLENLLALDYPAEKRQIIVVSDGSTDGTDELVGRYAHRGVELVRLDPAGGKARAINAAVARARGELLLFCDARQRIDPQALRSLVRVFTDPAVGAASGELMLGREQGPGLYWSYEKLIRQAEGRFDSVVGATGALYAIRRALFRELPEGCLLDDVFVPMSVVRQGSRVLFVPTAQVFDDEAAIEGEFSRKARTLAGNFQLLTQLPWLLDPRENRLWMQFVSHKLLRLVCPFALATLFASNVALVATGAPGWPLYAATLAAQLGVYGLAAYAQLAGPAEVGRLARVSHTFVALNAAAVEGLRRFLIGDLGWTTHRAPA